MKFMNLIQQVKTKQHPTSGRALHDRHFLFANLVLLGKSLRAVNQG